MSLEDDLQRLALQEQRLRFDQFSPERAWDVGVALRQAAMQSKAALAIDISLAGQQLFHCVMPGATPNNADWIRRKRNVVLRFHRSSYAMGRQMQQRGTTLLAAYDLPLSDYADHGGSFPLNVADLGCVGAISVSGLPQRDDHGLVVETLAKLLHQNIDDIRLGA